MIYKRKDKKLDSDVDQETPVSLPRQETLSSQEKLLEKVIETIPKETVIEVARQVIETHKDTLEKLRDSDFTHTALSVMKNVNTGIWSLVEIKYDPANLTVSPKIFLTDLNTNLKEEAEIRFKIAALEKVI